MGPDERSWRGHSTSLLDGDTLHERMHPAFVYRRGVLYTNPLKPASEPAETMLPWNFAGVAVRIWSSS